MRQEKEDQENDRHVQNPRPVIRGSLPARLLALSLQGLELLYLLCSHCKLRAQPEPTEEQGRWQLTKKRHHRDARTLKDLLLRCSRSPGRWRGPCLRRGRLLAPKPSQRNQMKHTRYGLPWGLRWYRICLQRGRPGFHPWVRKTPWGREW